MFAESLAQSGGVEWTGEVNVRFHSGRGSCSLCYDPSIWDKCCSFSIDSYSRICWVIAVLFVWRAQQRRWVTELNGIRWDDSAAEMWMLTDLRHSPNLMLMQNTQTTLVLPLKAADSHTCMSECLTMFMLDLVHLDEAVDYSPSLWAPETQAKVICGIITGAAPLPQIWICLGQSSSFMYIHDGNTWEEQNFLRITCLAFGEEKKEALQWLNIAQLASSLVELEVKAGPISASHREEFT